jgi:1-acyl-sn-glycerol-3-phosphate acyltransferase
MLAGHAWGAYWQLMRKYHRFEVVGLENVLVNAGSALIVGYHGSPGARDLIMLQMLLLKDHGEVTHAITHDLVFRIPLLGAVAEGMELIGRDPKRLDEAIERGEKLVVTPGGIQEAWSAYRDRYTVRWRGLGYLRLALKHRLPIIPVAAVGVDDAFLGLYDAYRLWQPLWKRYNLPEGAGVWLGLGPTGIWPFTPPFPSHIVQYIAPPICLEDEGITDPDDRPALLAFHRRLVALVQEMLDRGRGDVRARGGARPEATTWIDQVG